VGSDFVDLTIARLGLTAQRREFAEATRWLATEDRELLALWWLESSGELTRPEVVAALAEPAWLVARRITRVRTELCAAHLTVRALGADPRCRPLGRIAGRWDGAPTPLWRRRFGRHITGCGPCAAAGADRAEPEALLIGLPLLIPARPAE
jgi:hypothetical protein